MASRPRPIHQLPPDLVGKIAAGEVVERPASVVKELVENALDAGARTIEVRLEQGGLKAIEIADDGGGIPQEELPLAVAEHATSKVDSYEDLFRLETLGFRGEALSAIARVSDLSIVSAVAAGEAHELTPDGTVREAVRDQGTTITVLDLFHNTPARRKFMKTASRELMAVTEMVLGYALMHPEVGFLLTDGNRTVLKALPQEEVGARVAELFGLEAFKGLVEVQGDENPVVAQGFLSRPSATRSDSRKLFLLVNGRLVQDRWLQGSLISRYRGMIPPRKYPYGVLDIRLPPHLVDVNVHPTKREVRFVSNGPVFVSLSRAVDQATRVVGAFSDALPGGHLPEPGLSAFRPPPSTSGTLMFEAREHGASFQSFSRPHRPGGSFPPSQPSSFPREDQATPVHVPAGQGGYEGTLRFLSQLYNTYLLFTLDGMPYVADQHVAHERVLYDGILRALKERGTVPSQGLLVPLPLNLSPPEVVQVEAHREELARYGVDVEPFGEGTVLIRGLPHGRKMGNASLQALLSDLLNALDNKGDISDVDQAMAARMSCRSAIMAGDPIGPQEAAELIKNLLACQNPDTCPHGRPIISRLSEEELAPRFHRPQKPKSTQT